MAEYGISGATVSNRVRSYREECQNNDEEKSQLEMMEERRSLRREKAELEKENSFLKKSSGILRDWLVAYRFLDAYKQEFGLRWIFNCYQRIQALYHAPMGHLKMRGGVCNEVSLLPQSLYKIDGNWLKRAISQSMSRAGGPYDNAPMERYYNTLKT